MSIDKTHDVFLVEQPGVGIAINYMTKPELAEWLCDLADVRQGMRVLEPSAGTGVIAAAARNRGALVECVEINPEFVAFLRSEGFVAYLADFGAWHAAHLYERVVMNPPFNGVNMLDFQHIKRAWGMLATYGKLVSVVHEHLPTHASFLAWVYHRGLQLTTHPVPPHAYGPVKAAVVVLHA